MIAIQPVAYSAPASVQTGHPFTVRALVAAELRLIRQGDRYLARGWVRAALVSYQQARRCERAWRRQEGR